MAADIDFPSFIRPTAGYSWGYVATNKINTPVAGGMPHVALDYVRQSVPFDLSFTCRTWNQMAAYNDWFFNISQQGTKKFNISLNTGDGQRDYVGVIIPGTHNITGNKPFTITCVIEVETLDYEQYDGSLYAAEGPDYGCSQ